VQRKVFRVERMFGGRAAARPMGIAAPDQAAESTTEVIDDSARALTATLKDDYKRGLAQEIQEHVVKIYEGCNFQDLSGQRIGHVIETLNKIENQVEGMLERHSGQPGEAPAGKPFSGHALLNDPRLDGDSGHTSQRDIDKMFG
jgi:chemotaxis protein CheZ